MTLLETHLEQISLSTRSIVELQFPPPKIFTNALLGNHEITTLIRDTEPHERALFSIDPSSVNSTAARKTRRQTAVLGAEKGGFGNKNVYNASEPRKQSAVARVLGPDMLQEIQQSGGSTSRTRSGASGAVNVEILLRGAEKLCAVYTVQGATEKITSLRNRHKQTSESIARYEEQVMKQQARLDRMNKGSDYGHEYQHNDEDGENGAAVQAAEPMFTEFDLQAEEQEIQELEAKKKALELRVAGMEKDLGGLLR